MQFLEINDATTLSQLNSRVGSRNVESILSTNGLPRVPNIGKALSEICSNVVNYSSTGNVEPNQKVSLLNNMVSDIDIFEHTSMLADEAWQIFRALGTFPGMLKIPETANVASGSDILGNAIRVPKEIYQKVTNSILQGLPVDTSSFNEYSHIRSSSISVSTASTLNGFDAFKIPWGDITLYSSVADDSMDFPVYPIELSDSRQANYTTMPDMLYQYEPWQLYQSSGPRSNIYKFTFHRDMFNWDHRQGGANKLIRFCEANCFVNYKGSAIEVPSVTLYIKGKPLITGIMTKVDTQWSGPIGQDGWYLMCDLEISITEVSDEPLNFDVIRNKKLIG